MLGQGSGERKTGCAKGRTQQVCEDKYAFFPIVALSGADLNGSSVGLNTQDFSQVFCLLGCAGSGRCWHKSFKNQWFTVKVAGYSWFR